MKLAARAHGAGKLVGHCDVFRHATFCTPWIALVPQSIESGAQGNGVTRVFCGNARCKAVEGENRAADANQRASWSGEKRRRKMRLTRTVRRQSKFVKASALASSELIWDVRSVDPSHQVSNPLVVGQRVIAKGELFPVGAWSAGLWATRGTHWAAGRGRGAWWRSAQVGATGPCTPQ